MRFSQLYGNEDIRKALVGMADSGRVPHAILFHENDGGGALALALAFLQYLNCPHRSGGDACGQCPSCNQHEKLIYPDIRFTFPITSGSKVSGEVSKLTCDDYLKYWRDLVSAHPYFLESELSEALGIEKKTGVIAVAEGKAILAKLALAGVSDGYRAVVVWLPERMNVQTANMLLKAVEEPAERTLFLMITHSPESVLQTIASRCLRIRVLPLSRSQVQETLEKEFGIPESDAAVAASLSGGSVGVALQYLSNRAGMQGMAAVFRTLVEAILSRDYEGTLDVAEELAALDGREKQKAFCIFAAEAVRRLFLLQQGLEDIALSQPDERAWYADSAARLGKTFCRRSTACLERAVTMIDRNVNQKIVFTNLVSRMFTSHV